MHRSVKNLWRYSPLQIVDLKHAHAHYSHCFKDVPPDNTRVSAVSSYIYVILIPVLQREQNNYLTHLVTHLAHLQVLLF